MKMMRFIGEETGSAGKPWSIVNLKTASVKQCGAVFDEAVQPLLISRVTSFFLLWPRTMLGGILSEWRGKVSRYAGNRTERCI